MAALLCYIINRDRHCNRIPYFQTQPGLNAALILFEKFKNRRFSSRFSSGVREWTHDKVFS